MKNRNTSITLLLTVVITFLAVYLVRLTYDSFVGDALEIAIAAIGVLLVLFQLKKDHQINKAEFIYRLNQNFSENANISVIYELLKKSRDEGIVKVFSKEDGRKMGDYIMFFEIMAYLVAEGIVSMALVDTIFANKFFLFAHHPQVWEYQMAFDEINLPFLTFFIKWHNYREKKGQRILYNSNQLENQVITTHHEYFCKTKKARNGRQLYRYNGSHQKCSPDSLKEPA